MNIDILVVISTADALPIARPLLSAAQKAKCRVAVFLTNDGVTLASRQQLGDELISIGTAVACSESWSRFAQDESCPVALGSQTDHSQLASNADCVVSL